MKYIVQPVLQGSAFVPGTTPAAQAKIYTLAAFHTGQVASVRNGAIILEQRNWAEEPRQQWRIEPLSGNDSGYFRIVSVQSGNVMGVTAPVTSEGAQIAEQPWNGSQTQQWKIELLGAVAVCIVSRASGKVLDVSGSSSQQGTPLVQWTRRANTWEEIPGRLKWVSVGVDGAVWGVNVNDDIWRRDGNTWTQIPGKLKQISVGSSSHIWGVNANDDIWRRDGNTWTHIPGKLKNVSVGSDGMVWGVNANDDIWRRDGNTWIQIAGKLKQISVGHTGYVWGVNANDDIWCRDGDTWIQIPGKLKQVSVSAEGLVWGVNANDDIWRRDSNTWTHIPGKLKQVSSGSQFRIWGVNSNDQIFSWNAGLSQQWQLSTLLDQQGAYGLDLRATIYEHGNYAGRAEEIGIGSYDMATLTIGNDTLSSLRVPEGLRVTLYQHPNFQGATRSFSADTSWVGNDFNDQTSAILVEPVITVYEHGSFQGRSQQFGVGTFDMDQLSGVGNDVISSIKVPYGLMAILYEHANFTGRFRIFTESAVWLGDDFNDITSSIVVKAIGAEIPIGALEYGNSVVLRSNRDGFMSAGSNGNVSANTETIAAGEQFTIVRSGASRFKNYVCYGDIVSFRSAQNKYVGVDATGQVMVNRDTIGEAEKWMMLRSGDSISQVFVAPGDGISLRSNANRYMAAEPDGRVTASRTAIEPGTRWIIRTPTVEEGSHNSHGGDGSALATYEDEACPSDVCGAAICGADACGVAACGAAGTLAGACGVAAAVLAVCGSDVCGVALGVVTACGGAVGTISVCGGAAGGLSGCGADACGAAVCGAAACAAAACGAAACGAAASGADVCGGAACAADADAAAACAIATDMAQACAAHGAAVSACLADVCGANACAINACPADACAADACAIDVIPIIPGI